MLNEEKRNFVNAGINHGEDINAVQKKVIAAIRQYGMIKNGDKIIVALSGGADSVTLLHCLNEIKETIGFELFACHVNHNLRGKDSDEDQAYTESLCGKMNIPIRVFSIDVLGMAQKHQSVEERARALRYEAFSEEASRLGAKVATAHNSCDNTETVFLNMLRMVARHTEQLLPLRKRLSVISSGGILHASIVRKGIRGWTCLTLSVESAL